MNQTDSSTTKYQVIGATPQGKESWGKYETWQEACDRSAHLENEIDGISFYVKDAWAAPTDQEIMDDFSHLDFGVA